MKTSRYWLLALILLIGIALGGTSSAGPRGRARRYSCCQQCVPCRTDNFCRQDLWFVYEDENQTNDYWVYWVLQDGDCGSWYWYEYDDYQTDPPENCTSTGTSAECSIQANYVYTATTTSRRTKKFKNNIKKADFFKAKGTTPETVKPKKDEIALVLNADSSPGFYSIPIYVIGANRWVRLFTVTTPHPTKPGYITTYPAGYEIEPPSREVTSGQATGVLRAGFKSYLDVNYFGTTYRVLLTP